MITPQFPQFSEPQQIPAQIKLLCVCLFEQATSPFVGDGDVLKYACVKWSGEKLEKKVIPKASGEKILFLFFCPVVLPLVSLSIQSLVMSLSGVICLPAASVFPRSLSVET